MKNSRKTIAASALACVLAANLALAGGVSAFAEDSETRGPADLAAAETASASRGAHGAMPHEGDGEHTHDRGGKVPDGRQKPPEGRSEAPEGNPHARP